MRAARGSAAPADAAPQRQRGARLNPRAIVFREYLTKSFDERRVESGRLRQNLAHLHLDLIVRVAEEREQVGDDAVRRRLPRANGGGRRGPHERVRVRDRGANQRERRRGRRTERAQRPHGFGAHAAVLVRGRPFECGPRHAGPSAQLAERAGRIRAHLCVHVAERADQTGHHAFALAHLAQRLGRQRAHPTVAVAQRANQTRHRDRRGRLADLPERLDRLRANGVVVVRERFDQRRGRVFGGLVHRAQRLGRVRANHRVRAGQPFGQLDGGIVVERSGRGHRFAGCGAHGFVAVLKQLDQPGHGTAGAPP